MDEQRFDALVRAVSSGTSRRGVLGVLAGGMVAVLRGRGVALADHKPGHCPKTDRCKGFHVCTPTGLPHCEPVRGFGCSCVLSVEGCRACVDENVCGPACASSAECMSRPGFGPRAICEAQGCGACALRCMKPCPV